MNLVSGCGGINTARRINVYRGLYVYSYSLLKAFGQSLGYSKMDSGGYRIESVEWYRLRDCVCQFLVVSLLYIVISLLYLVISLLYHHIKYFYYISL